MRWWLMVATVVLWCGASTAIAGDGETTQELGGRLGLRVGGGSTPGGVLIAGNYIYRLTEHDWLDGYAAFTFGGRSAACFRDRENDLVCDHGLIDGFSGELALGIRRYLLVRDKFQPFVRGGVAIGGANFSKDEINGLVLPLWAGGGVRARVAPTVSVTGGALIRAGVGFFGRGLGIRPQLSLGIDFGVEFALD